MKRAKGVNETCIDLVSMLQRSGIVPRIVLKQIKTQNKCRKKEKQEQNIDFQPYFKCQMKLLTIHVGNSW